MKELNKLRLAAGLPIDPSLEKSEKKEKPVKESALTEARETPRRKADLHPKDGKSLRARKRYVEQAIKHIVAAISALEKAPAIDFSGDIPRFIGELEDLLDADGTGGMNHYLKIISSELEDYEKSNENSVENNEESDENEKEVKENNQLDNYVENLSDEEKEQLKIAITALKLANADDVIKETAYNTLVDIMKEHLEEAMHYYGIQYDSFETDKNKPVNVSNGTSNDEQVWDEMEQEKNEFPTQLRTMDQQDNSKQDQAGDDLTNKVKVPNGIKQSLRTEIEKAKREAEKLDVRDKDAATFYKDLARAFTDLLNHLEKGTRYDIKQAQVYAQSLMGPMLHKIPSDVWKFLTNGGETRSLKSYMQEVGKKYPITGPRNKLK